MRYNNSRGQLTYQLDIDKQQKNGFPIPMSFKTTGKIGSIIPTQCLEVSYGDTIKNKSSVDIQFNPLAVPIMANMHIKQEHYYVPFNCVCSYWDDFISGGEDMEFSTRLPMVSIYDIVNMLSEHFNIYNSCVIINDREDAIYLVMERNTFLENVDELKAEILELGETTGTTDLLEYYVLPHLQKAYDLVSNYDFASQPGYVPGVTSIENIPIMQMPYMVPTDENDFSNHLRLPFDYELPEYIESAINKIRKVNITNNKYLSIKPNDFFVKLYDTLFNMLRPFVGVGSYVDSLNMFRLLPEDFYFGVLSTVYNAINAVIQAPISPKATDISLIGNYMFSQRKMRALELRALYLIWYNNYRDQLLETKAHKPETTPTITNRELFELLIPRHRCWDKDTYTTALDNPATGDAIVPTHYNQEIEANAFKINPNSPSYDEIIKSDMSTYSIGFVDGRRMDIPTGFISGLVNGGKDYSQEYTEYFSLHMLEAVKRAQKFLRKALFFGNRIQDFIYSTYGVKYLDARLRLPELLATSRQMVKLNTLVNNTTTAESIAGDKAGYAYGTDDGNYFERYCEESGLIISIMSIVPEPSYGYGSNRQFYRLDRFDYMIPEFATLGMDAVMDSELTHCPFEYETKDLGLVNVFGYQGRYYDLKYRQSTEHGELLTTQDMYTFARKWDSYFEDERPKLNPKFVHCFPRLDMFVMNDNTQDYWRADVFHDTNAEMLLPYHSVYL